MNLIINNIKCHRKTVKLRTRKPIELSYKSKLRLLRALWHLLTQFEYFQSEAMKWSVLLGCYCLEWVLLALLVFYNGLIAFSFKEYYFSY